MTQTPEPDEDAPNTDKHTNGPNTGDDHPGDTWVPEPAKLRTGETTDDDAHARRNAEMLAMAEEELADQEVE